MRVYLFSPLSNTTSQFLSYSRIKIGQINVMDKIWDRKSFEDAEPTKVER